MKKFRARWPRALWVVVGLSFVGIIYHGMRSSRSPNSEVDSRKTVFTKDKIAEALGNSTSFYQFPNELELRESKNTKIHGKVHYTFNMKLQKDMEVLFQQYNPDYGAFVALDAKTGQVLSMVSYSRSGKIQDNLALRASFPSASVFKVVTAAAAIEEHNISKDTVIPVNGRYHTLYRKQILKSNITRWTKFMTLKEAFARSVNMVFGKIGAYTVGSEGLRIYAGRFGFNRRISADLPIQEGKAWIPDDLWGLAESASGFTRDNTMSPLQGALIGASVVNEGVMMEPYIVDSIVNVDNRVLYKAEPKVASKTMDPATAIEMKALMKETVLHGTSRGSFKGFFKKSFSVIDVGGKTGSLTGFDPKGKYDWFVGYADSGNRRIAVAALTIHEKQWRVKSSYLARRAIESYFKENPRHVKTIANRE